MAEKVGSDDELPAANGELEALAAARALRCDVAVGMQRAGNAERVPATRPGPGLAP